MALFVVLLWCTLFLKRYGGSNNSRFGESNSRLAGENSRFGLLRESTCDPLIWLSIFTGTWRFFRENRRNSRFDGKNREFRSGQCIPPRQRPDPTLEGRAGAGEIRSAGLSLRLQPAQHDPVECFGVFDIGEMAGVRDLFVAAAWNQPGEPPVLARRSARIVGAAHH